MSGAIPPLPNMPSWRGAYLSTRTTLLYFTLLTILIYVLNPLTSYRTEA